MTLLATVVALSIIVSACLAWDFGRRWLEERAATRATDEERAALHTRMDEHERVQKMLAEDWMKRFRGLEADWKQLKVHADSQFAGTIAQLESQKTRGFGR